MADPIRVKRGTRAQINAAATANQLVAGEPYLITDEGRFAVGKSTSTYETFGKQSENVPFPGYRSAQWHNFHPRSSTVATANLVINVLRTYVIKVESAVVITQRSLTVGTANAGSLVRVGLYNLGAGFYPTTLINNSDIGQIDCGVTGVKTNPFASPISLAAGHYGLAYACNGVLANLTCYTLASTAFIPLPERAIAQPANRLNGWTGAFAFAALPSTYPAGHTPIQFTTTSPEVLFLTQ
jgi:hypothetical protein